MSLARVIPAAAALLCVLCAAASAQSAATAAGSTPTAPETATPATDLDRKPGTLSDKLSGTDGIVEPTGDVDPGMHRPTPQTGTMPVIEPRQVPKDGGHGTVRGETGGLY